MSHFLGLRTAIYAAPQLDELKNWYSQALGIKPYFDEPFYVGFNVGGYELGLDPNASAGAGTSVAYWGVADIHAAYQHLLNLGATPHQEVTNVGDDIYVATVYDPANNLFGIIQNPHFQVL
ncbi:MAG: VOC family protein [Spirosomataceae bacterium]